MTERSTKASGGTDDVRPAPSGEDGRADSAGLDGRLDHRSYVAFAFAAADMLIESDFEGRMLFVIGASMSLVGRPARLLTGMGLPELIRQQDRSRLQRALKRMREGQRVRHILVRVQPPDQRDVPVALSGYAHPDHPDRLLLVLTHAAGLSAKGKGKSGKALLDKEDFAALTENLSREGGGGSDGEYRMTLLDLPEIAELRSRLGPEATAQLLKGLADYLSNSSLGGDSAADFGEHRYGLIHGPEISAADIERTITELIAQITGGEASVQARTATMLLDLDEGITAEEAASALVYTINRFSADGGATLQELTEAAKPQLSATVSKMRAVKQVISKGEFELYFQPVVNLLNSAVHHFECLVRFGNGENSPYGTVTFAEDTGMIGELDLAICSRVFGFMRESIGNDQALRFAINLSGRSLSSDGIAARLLKSIDKAPDLRGRILFEVTESAEIVDLDQANMVIQAIRNRGHLVGLDDFGAGAAAFHYLRALKVDHVKIDGSYVREATESSESLPFLRAITQLCKELKIATIAEHVEDEKTASLLRVLNVHYGQGFYFGRPVRLSQRHRGDKQFWVTPQTHWRNGVLFFHPPGRLEKGA